MIQQIKESIGDYLVRLGPESWVFQAVFRLRAKLLGFELENSGGRISIQKGTRTLILGGHQFIFVPFILNCFDLYFETIAGEVSNGQTILDFSKPGLHCYKKNKVAFHFPSIPEDDVMDAYTADFVPKSGDVVWDAGAHAGATAYFLAQMVGQSGRVFAFEPDDANYEFLVKNIDLHRLSNVIPVKKALAANTGTAQFWMDGTQASTISTYVPRGDSVQVDSAQLKSIPTISIRDACEEFGMVPAFIKMDIEGAEVEAIEGSSEFLRRNPVHFVFESNHRAHGEMTYKALERLFPQIGYDVWSSDKFGQMFTWARPSVRKE